ncbi:ATP-binding protein [Alkalihalobacillus sp. LMS39]|uniref:ATP-binding protein n=1 Tax=Alkalihalobacillus sp. LMS39 TaxID=2924032 RepID=UPI001FB3D703|nr:ATP-binding protein [Alkalihalobacillus sp. LMS39]UOE96358.1 ATP-binding protein [Alkalihalobacillus sp. LMS39]
MLELGAREKLNYFLETNKNDLLTLWENKITETIEDTPVFLFEGANAIYSLVLSFIKQPSDQLIQHYAKETAEKIAQADDIKDEWFVYSSNICRSVILESFEQLDVSISEFQSIMQSVNSCVDEFIFKVMTFSSQMRVMDIGERETIVEQSHKDRLSLLGKMSSSFVHEFRNPLTAVMGFVKLLKEDHYDPRYLDIITHELDQLNFRITQFLLASKREVSSIQKRELFQVKKLFTEIIEFLYPSIVDGDVIVETDIENSVYLQGYREEIRQVYINLIMNSIDALYLIKSNRTITITVKYIEDNIVISVKNNGPSISSSVMNTIFEPFFTTKKMGTGIGLYVSKRIIEKHYGTIICESNEEETVFITTFQQQ